MYGGRIVELAPKQQLFERPRHPYTEVLLASVLRPDPRLRGGAQSASTDGSGLASGGPACVFASRCPYVIDRCRVEAPALQSVGPEHAARCHRIDELSLTPLPRRARVAGSSG